MGHAVHAALHRPLFHVEPESALAQVRAIYAQQIHHLRDAMQRFVAGEALPGHVRACYPFVRIHTDTVVPQDVLENMGLSYGFVAGAGRFETTLTRPDLYGNYYLEQFRLLRRTTACRSRWAPARSRSRCTSRSPRTTTSKAR
jgi:AMP nucleosidase